MWLVVIWRAPRIRRRVPRGLDHGTGPIVPSAGVACRWSRRCGSCGARSSALSIRGFLPCRIPRSRVLRRVWHVLGLLALFGPRFGRRALGACRVLRWLLVVGSGQSGRSSPALCRRLSGGCRCSCWDWGDSAAWFWSRVGSLPALGPNSRVSKIPQKALSKITRPNSPTRKGPRPREGARLAAHTTTSTNTSTVGRSSGHHPASLPPTRVVQQLE